MGHLKGPIKRNSLRTFGHCSGPYGTMRVRMKVKPYKKHIVFMLGVIMDANAFGTYFQRVFNVVFSIINFLNFMFSKIVANPS